MRLLVVSNTYIIAFNQIKWAEMKHQCKDLELKILTAKEIHHTFGKYTREIASDFSPKEIVDIRSFNTRFNYAYILDPFRFVKILKEFKPNRIHIEEDPYSLVALESIFLAGRFCPQAKISFFIWDNLARDPYFPLNRIKWGLNRYSLSKGELVVCGNKEGEFLLKERKGYKGRTAVLPQLGLDENDYLKQGKDNLRDVLNIPENIVLIGYIGRLVSEKGIFLLLESLCCLLALPWRVIIVGSGPLESEIKTKWKSDLGERLMYKKAVDHAKVPAYMKALDIFVLPSYSTSRWKEQFGLVLAQAMLAGVPCIGSSSGAIPDVIGPGGVIFKEKDDKELASALERLILNEKERKSLGEAGRKFAMQNYTHASVGKAYLKLFGWLSDEEKV